MYSILHGLPLPELGSFEYYLLETAMMRERAEKVEFAQFLAALLGSSTGLNADQLGQIISRYAEVVTQVRYNSKYESAYAKAQKILRAKQEEDARLLDKVRAMTVDWKR